MKTIQQITKAVLSFALLLPFIASANVVRPALDIQFTTGDDGAVLSGDIDNGFIFDIDATALAFVFDDAPSIDINNQSFTLHGTEDPSVNGFIFSGTFEVGGSLLTGTFNDLELDFFNDDIWGEVIGFSANLFYDDGGSLKGNLSSGRIEGFGNGNNLSAKLGPVTVVPVPAAVWLFGSGLIGLIGIARRRT